MVFFQWLQLTAPVTLGLSIHVIVLSQLFPSPSHGARSGPRNRYAVCSHNFRPFNDPPPHPTRFSPYQLLSNRLSVVNGSILGHDPCWLHPITKCVLIAVSHAYFVLLVFVFRNGLWSMSSTPCRDDETGRFDAPQPHTLLPFPLL